MFGTKVSDKKVQTNLPLIKTLNYLTIPQK